VSLGILRRIVKTLKGVRGFGVDAVDGLLLSAIRCSDKQNPSLVGCCYVWRWVWWLKAWWWGVGVFVSATFTQFLLKKPITAKINPCKTSIQID
jgi:hypothetical protein